ncbi:hypothetical protein A2U01_0064663, partial [Trifolium medium]|nr:hypothetical protein [Trifolium medium]
RIDAPGAGIVAPGAGKFEKVRKWPRIVAPGAGEAAPGADEIALWNTIEALFSITIEDLLLISLGIIMKLGLKPIL